MEAIDVQNVTPPAPEAPQTRKSIFDQNIPIKPSEAG